MFTIHTLKNFISLLHYFFTLLCLRLSIDIVKRPAPKMQPSGSTAKLKELKVFAKKATSKLEWEGRQKERCLRRLVLTANMIDGLADEIDGLETPAKPEEEVCHIEMAGWTDSVADGFDALQRQLDVAVEDDDVDCDSDSDMDSDSVTSEESEEATTPRRLSEEHVQIKVHECALDDDDDWDMGEVTDLSLKLFPTKFPGQQNDHGANPRVVVEELQSDHLFAAVDQAMIDQT